jgi:alkanesulfonate monooxygenase SsuD/methylene tetrahydromethanopterin reductase-like flavin-dependent oxidoreductase (luciferase family)
MKVGIYFDLRNPPGWQQNSSRLYGFTLEMIEEAERLGADSIWLTEHHLFEDGYLTQPLTYAAAVAARTRRIRIGTAIVTAPFYPAIAIAEQSSIVDILSNGRLELGLGAGYRIPEYALYGADFGKRFSATDTRAREVRAIWADQKMLPHPVQPRVPIWMGYAGPKNARRAGILGEGLLTLAPELVAPYQQGLADGGHPLSSARMSGILHGWFPEDPDLEWPAISRFVGYWLDSYKRYAFEGTGLPPPAPVDLERLRQNGLNSRVTPTDMDGVPFLYATPERAAREIRAFTENMPVEHVFFWASFAGMPEEMVARNIHTICTKLAPLIR